MAALGFQEECTKVQELPIHLQLLYQSTGVADGSVTYQKTTFFSASKNLFDKSQVTPNKGVSYVDGTILDLAGYNASAYIPVLPLTTYTRSYTPARKSSPG